MEKKPQNSLVPLPDTEKTKVKRSYLKLLSMSCLFIGLFLTIAIAITWKKNFVLQKRLLYVEKHLISERKDIKKMAEELIGVESAIKKQDINLIQTKQQIELFLSQERYYATLPILLDIQHLISEADINVKYNQNIASAIILLKAAEERISTLTEIGNSTLRQSLIDTIVALKLLPQIDTDHLLATLIGLQKQIREMPLFKITQSAPIAIQHKEPTPKDWKVALANTWDKLQKMIIIRQHSKPITPLLPQDQVVYLKQHLEWQLQQLIEAVILKNDSYYQANLKEMIMWVTNYYSSNPEGSQKFIAILNELQKETLKPSVPDLTPLLIQIKQLQKHVLKQQISVDKNQTQNKMIQTQE
ncbi:MAG: hypothetical protein LEGION0398_MBIBDBAK_01358 [Legionellaceae bacterium]